jgi:hypothetical protein
VVEIVHAKVTVFDQGIFRTEEEVKGVVLDDSRMVKSTEVIRECTRCLRLVHVDNSCRCARCRQTFCENCTEKFDEEGRGARACVECVRSARDPVVLRSLRKLIWGR